MFIIMETNKLNSKTKLREQKRKRSVQTDSHICSFNNPKIFKSKISLALKRSKKMREGSIGCDHMVRSGNALKLEDRACTKSESIGMIAALIEYKL